MKRFSIYLPIVAAVAAIIAGCAKETSTSDIDQKRDYFLAWMAQNHPGLNPNSDGIYILEDEDGSGPLYSGEEFIYVDITIMDLEGNISSTTSERLSKQLGTYDAANYYGPKMNKAGSSINAGLEAILSNMHVGGHRKAIVPFWLTTYSRYSTEKDYYANTTSSASNVMYDITLRDFTDNSVTWEIDSLERHLVHVYKEAPDSVSWGLYYYREAEPKDEVAFPSDTTIYINYTGSLLNGQVFDTNIEKVAKDNNIYSTSGSYSPVSIKISENAEGITMGGSSSSVITGFAKAILLMHKYEKGKAWFISTLGYNTSGSGDKIPPYSPLCFEIEVVDAK